MKALKKIPLPDSLEPYTAVILYHRYKSEQEKLTPSQQTKPMTFLAQVASVTALTGEKIFPWLLVLPSETMEDVLSFSKELGSKIGYATPTALLKGYMEFNGFGTQSEQDLGVAVYTLALFISGMGLFEYDDFDDLKALVRRFYTGNSESN